jgi:hypothetical protein
LVLALTRLWHAGYRHGSFFSGVGADRAAVPDQRRRRAGRCGTRIGTGATWAAPVGLDDVWEV